MATRSRLITRARRQADVFANRCLKAVEDGDIVICNESTKQLIIKDYLLLKNYTVAADVAEAAGQAMSRAMETGRRFQMLTAEVSRYFDELPAEVS